MSSCGSGNIIALYLFTFVQNYLLEVYIPYRLLLSYILILDWENVKFLDLLVWFSLLLIPRLIELTLVWLHFDDRSLMMGWRIYLCSFRIHFLIILSNIINIILTILISLLTDRLNRHHIDLWFILLILNIQILFSYVHINTFFLIVLFILILVIFILLTRANTYKSEKSNEYCDKQ